MEELLLLGSVIILLCVFVYKYLSKYGIPMLLVFMGLGLIFGESGIFKIHFDDFVLSNNICTIALLFIIFFGGFSTKVSAARGVVLKSIILSSFGVIFTAILTGIFCFYVLKFDFLTSFLIGSVLSSTDAASVFSILRSHKLNLKENTASLLEIESGSNDPFAYVLTIVFLNLNNNVNVLKLLFAQIFFGLIIGYIFAKISVLFLRTIKNLGSGFMMALLTAMAIFVYTLSNKIGGNGYIAAYLFGIIVGNSRFNNKSEIVHFFDGLTSIMQMVIFFLLGLLVNPSQAYHYAFLASIIMIAMTFLIRPIVVYLLLTPLKSSNNQKLLVSFAGLRGAGSIVFSIMVVNSLNGYYKIFDITFIVVLLSIAFQGFLLPKVSKKIDMIDENENVLKTFTDYSEEEDVDFITFEIDENHDWIDKKIKDIHLMPSVLLVLIIRENKNIIPNGDTIIKENDKIVLCGSSFIDKQSHIRLFETIIDEKSDYNNRKVKNIDTNFLIVMIKRNNKIMIPRGDTTILNNDKLVMLDRNYL